MRRSTRGLTPFILDGHEAACHWAEDIKAGKIQPQEREAIFEAGQTGAPAFVAPALEGP